MLPSNSFKFITGDMFSPSVDSTIYSIDLTPRELLKLTRVESKVKNDIGDCGGCDNCDKCHDRNTRTMTISRLTYNLSEFDAIYRKSHDDDGDGNYSKNLSDKSKRNKSGKSIILSAVCRFIPILTWLQTYNWSTELKADIFAGITVAVFQIPQCMLLVLIVAHYN